MTLKWPLSWSKLCPSAFQSSIYPFWTVCSQQNQPQSLLNNKQINNFTIDSFIPFDAIMGDLNARMTRTWQNLALKTTAKGNQEGPDILEQLGTSRTRKSCRKASAAFQMCWDNTNNPAPAVSAAGAAVFTPSTAANTHRCARTHLPNTEQVGPRCANTGPQKTSKWKEGEQNS